MSTEPVSSTRAPRSGGAPPSSPDAPAPGRRIVLVPAPPGLWLIVLGGSLAVLAPLFGFLVGTTLGRGDEPGLSPIHLGLFLGFVLGGAGVGVALAGATRLIRRHAPWAAEHGDLDDDPDDPPAGGDPAPAAAEHDAS